MMYFDAPQKTNLEKTITETGTGNVPHRDLILSAIPFRRPTPKAQTTRSPRPTLPLLQKLCQPILPSPKLFLNNKHKPTITNFSKQSRQPTRHSRLDFSSRAFVHITKDGLGSNCSLLVFPLKQERERSCLAFLHTTLRLSFWLLDFPSKLFHIPITPLHIYT